MKKILIINGPNLNKLGEREIEIYGKVSLDEIKLDCKNFVKDKKIEISFFQSNSESEIIECIQNANGRYLGIIINAAAFTHTSIAIHDSLKIINCKKIEVHISNPYKRESFRQKSYISPVCDGIVSGFGCEVYKIAIFALNQLLGNTNE